MSRPMQVCVWDKNQAKSEKRPLDTPLSSRTSFGLFDGLFFFGGNLRLNLHVAEFARFEDLSAFEALHEFRIFVARHHLDSRMKARVGHCLALGITVSCVGRLDIAHNTSPDPPGQLRIERYCSPAAHHVKHFSRLECENRATRGSVRICHLGPSAAVRSWLLAVRLNRFGQCLNPSALTRGDQRRPRNGIGISTSLPEGQMNSFPKLSERASQGIPATRYPTIFIAN